MTSRGIPRSKRGKRERTENGEETLASNLTLAAMEEGKAFLGQYERQFRYVPGRMFKADFAFPAARLLVEVQGGIWARGEGASGTAMRGHGGPLGILKDNERLNLATMHGWRLLRFSTDQCGDREIGETIDTIEGVLRAGGLRG